MIDSVHSTVIFYMYVSPCVLLLLLLLLLLSLCLRRCAAAVVQHTLLHKVLCILNLLFRARYRDQAILLPRFRIRKFDLSSALLSDLLYALSALTDDCTR